MHSACLFYKTFPASNCNDEVVLFLSEGICHFMSRIAPFSVYDCIIEWVTILMMDDWKLK